MKRKRIKLETVKEYLKDIYYNGKTNQIMNAYLDYRRNIIDIAKMRKNGKFEGKCYILKLDNEIYVYETLDDLFEFSLTDNYWLTFISINCVDYIEEWEYAKHNKNN